MFYCKYFPTFAKSVNSGCFRRRRRRRRRRRKKKKKKKKRLRSSGTSVNIDQWTQHNIPEGLNPTVARISVTSSKLPFSDFQY
jgi:hypothetical protein